MGFIYNKPLSIEQVFSLYNTNGGNSIDSEEAKNAKNVSIFNGRFIVEEGMTLEQFEAKNLETYTEYEQLATQAYNAQQKKYNIDMEENESAKQQRPSFGLE